MSWKKYLIIGLVFFFLFLLANLPAQLGVSIAKMVAPQAMQQVRVYGSQGTLWAGQFDRIDYQGQSFQAVNWDLNLFSLLVGQVTADVSLRFNGQSVKANVSQSLFGGLTLSDVNAKLGAKQLVQMLRIPAMKLDGEFIVNLKTVELEGNRPTDIDGRVVWSGAETRFPQRILLGDLSATASTEDEIITVILKDGGGPLQMDATVSLDPENNYSLNGSMMARDGRQSMLGRSLAMLGSIDPQGKVTLSMKGNLKQFAFLTKR
jgi:general secretion pathway protein N